MPFAAGVRVVARMDRLARPTGPVLLVRDRLLLTVPAGAAEQLSGLLCWLGWAHLDGVLTAVPAEAPRPVGLRLLRADASPCGEPLARLVDTCADACARVQLERHRRTGVAQPWAFSYASRTLLGTRPRSLTS
ncbi:hypothetical protein [Streptacidiphilus fuscans]|uniref:Uncharacterized protein n=1 Tax=Streptacidiphilus fuscans TaxID=2789292 RepID=A0A931BBI0_9ACTN|nr:hypothetical protein [Streptacidiphilus fuscans]MBF9073526.1 hypothetical protein [Streptacidiphilus fuscans]